METQQPIKINSAEAAYLAGYRCDDEGNLYSPNGKRRSPVPNTSGYLSFNFSHDGRSYTTRVHRLQAFQKFGKAMFEPGIEVRHLDSNRQNNRPNNLALGTHSDNMQDLAPEVRRAKAIHATNHMKKHDHPAIVAFYNACNSLTKTAKHFGIKSLGTVHFIVRQSLAATTPTRA